MPLEAHMDELEPLPDFAQRLLDDERTASLGAPGPSPETLDRMLGRIERTVGLTSAVGAGVVAGVGMKLAIAGAGILMGVGATLSWQHLNGMVPAPIVVIQRVEVPVVVREGAPAPAPAPALAPAPAPRKLKAPDTLDAEQRLLDTARAALVQQRPDAALEALRQHGARFPAGQLAEERDALEVQVLWKAGRHAEARAKGTTFRRRFPASIFNAAIDALEKSP
jgi:hypothetical protein